MTQNPKDNYIKAKHTWWITLAEYTIRGWAIQTPEVSGLWSGVLHMAEGAATWGGLEYQAEDDYCQWVLDGNHISVEEEETTDRVLWEAEHMAVQRQIVQAAGGDIANHYGLEIHVRSWSLPCRKQIWQVWVPERAVAEAQRKTTAVIYPVCTDGTEVRSSWKEIAIFKDIITTSAGSLCRFWWQRCLAGHLTVSNLQCAWGCTIAVTSTLCASYIHVATSSMYVCCYIADMACTTAWDNVCCLCIAVKHNIPSLLTTGPPSGQ